MIGNDWDTYLKEEYDKPYFKELTGFVEKEYKEKTIYPSFLIFYQAMVVS